MDLDTAFCKLVLEKYQVDKLLTPLNVGNGEIENVILSDLRKELNFIFLDIGSDGLKEEFLNYIENFSITSRTVLIPSQKSKIKRIKKKVVNLKLENPILDIDNAQDEIIIEEISNLEWMQSQEEYIFHFLKEQKYFFHSWVAEKWKEFTQEPIKVWIENERTRENTNNLLDKILQHKQNKTVLKEPHFYCKIGALFAQNFIRCGKGINHSYYFKDMVFPNPNQLSEYIKREVLKCEKSVYQYVSDTLNDNDAPHNFYQSVTKTKNILQYCKDEKIKVINEKFLQFKDLK